MRLPPITSDVLQRIDCRTPLRRLKALIAGGAGGDDAFDAQWAQLHDALTEVGYLFMTDVHGDDELDST